MKRIAILLILATVLYGCDKPTDKAASTVLSGSITNPVTRVVELRLGSENLSDSLSAENTFSFALDIEKATEATFIHGQERTSLYLRPGDQLSLTIDPAMFDESLKYTGTGAEINNFKASMVLLTDTVPANAYMLSTMPEDSFLMAMNDAYQQNISLVNKANITDEAFINQFKNDLKWQFVYALVNYPSYRSYRTGGEFEPSENYNTYKDSLDFNDEANLAYSTFLPVVESMMREQAMQAIKDKGMDLNSISISDYYLASFEQYETLESDSIKERLYHDLLNSAFTRLSEEGLETTLTKWKALNPSKEKLTSMEEKLDKWAKVRPGNEAPSFKYVSIEGDSVSMEDLKGKVVYIDFWATWCGPCIKEHPDMEKLQEELKDENVAFVAISIDDTMEPWKKMVEQKKLGGIHLYADNAWSSKLVKDYMINGIPRFVLIDQEGLIVNPNANRPSGNVLEDIKALL